MLWWKEIADLKRRLNAAENDLQKEQGKAARLAGFLSRLQNYGISPVGQAPCREFAEALIDSARMLLNAEQVVLLKADPHSFDLLPEAALGIAPDVLSRLRVRPGESTLGQAAQSLKTVSRNVPAAGDEPFLTAPYLILPLISQGRGIGLLLIAKPREGPFSTEAQALASVLARQAALTLEDHAQHQELGELQAQMIAALSRAIEARDAYTHRHSTRTRALVRAVAEEIPLPEPLIREIEYGAFLHDIGKIGIEDAILHKTGQLTPQEYDAMKRHPSIGQQMLQPIPFLRQAAAIVLYHQEWYNGAGYPEGLAGEEIPLGARVVQIIDAWDAMTSDRPYRKAMEKAAAVAELRRQEGTQFDPKLVELFLRVIDRLERAGIPTTEEKIAAPVAAG